MTPNTEPFRTNRGSTAPTSHGDEWPDRYDRVDHVVETGSTNADLLAVASAGGGPTGGRAVVLHTDHQRQGRGRQDRGWYDNPGDSLLVSVLVELAVGSAALAPLAAGLAAVGCVRDLCVGPLTAPAVEPARRLVGLKWPNDVVAPAMGHRKLAGILVESTTVSSDRCALAVVIGMGMNVRRVQNPPEDVAARAVALADLAAVEGQQNSGPERDTVLSSYLRHLDTRLNELGDQGRLLDEYRRECVTLGRQVRLGTPSEVVEGQAIDIGPGGALIVRTAEGTERQIWSGDAIHPTDQGV